MKKKSLLIMLLVALFVPLAMNAQNVKLKKSANGSVKPKLEMKVSEKQMPANPLISRLESSKEAVLEKLNDREATRGTTTVTAEKITATTSTWTGSGGESWTAAITISNTSGLSQAVTNGYAQFGTQRNYATSGSFSTSGVSGTITSIVVDCASYGTTGSSTGAATVSATVGGAAFGTQNQSTPRWSNSTGGEVTFTGSASGSIVVTMTNGSSTHRAMYIKSITVTYQEDGCSAPEDFAATNVGTTSATFSWTETGTSDTWVIFYMSEEDTESSYVIADTNPYTLTGLEMETVYYALVTPYCGDIDQDSDVITFTTETTCPKPTNLSASEVTMSSATLSWDGEADSYSIRYRTAADNGEAVFSDDFEEASLNNWDWTTYSNGGTFSGYGWFAYDPTSLNSSFPSANSGSNCALSLSYDGSSDITADNYLVTPQVELGGTLKFYVMSNYSDTYEVLLSTGGNAVRDFDVTLQSLAAAPSSWTEVSIDLGHYEGEKGYIAIHHSMYGGFILFVDDFGIYGNAIPSGDWVTIENVTSPYTITGLSSETEYEWQVLANCGSDGQSAWVSADSFTTGSECDAPYGLTANNVTNSSAALSWTGYTDTYNVQYREYDPDELVTVILTAGDVWGDGSGYQMLLDADATAYDNFSTNGISDYSIFEYLIPTNADYSASTSNVVVNSSVSIQIPAGTYDCFIANPTPGDQVYVAGTSGNVGGRIDNYVFVAGKTYEFVPSRYGSGDGVDVTITADWTTVSGVANPYTLTGLNMDTQYEVQVQGVNCDGEGGTSDWSASAFFTTLNGTLVTSITADDVEVVVGATANITNLVVLPAEATNPAVTYTSNDETIATVNDNGVVTGVAVGTTTITIAATDGSNVRTDINVTVNGIDVTEITADNVTVATSETATITYTVAPNNATDQSVTFTSANTNIATVDADGVVTGVAVGETTITIASVSNPEVTAEITVTVTSNPNAVQFTVNVPATAQPGDVITVEAYMAAPTSGNYDGFTSLGVHLYYDNTAFQHTADPTYGAVGDACMLKQFSYPSDGVVRVAFVQPAGSPTTVTGLLFSMEFTVLAEAELGSSYTFQVEPMNAANFTCNYNNGSPATQIPYEFTPSTVVVAALETYIKHIDAYTTDKGGYYLIASPIGDVNVEAVGNMLDNQYDLYYFDQNQDLEWINYKQGGEFTSLNAGQGYLYANSEDTDLTFTGTAYSGNGEVRLTKDASNNPTGGFEGWNLVGNPFATTAYISGNRDFYVMNSDGDEITVADRQAIEAMEGVFVIAETDGEIITFTTEAPFKVAKTVINVTKDSRVVDRAIIRFGQGNTTPKIQINERSTKVYIPQENKDCAVVYADDLGEMPVNFKAATNGTYHLHINSQEVSYSYLHLIDNLTGADVDLLVNPSYSFEATTADYSSRFKLVFSTTTSVNENEFGFMSNGNFKIFGLEGQATLKVMDVTGRTLSTESFSGSYDKQLNLSAGVYMIQLIQGDNVKTQKIVVK